MEDPEYIQRFGSYPSLCNFGYAHTDKCSRCRYKPFTDEIRNLANAFEIKEIQSFIIKYLQDNQ